MAIDINIPSQVKNYANLAAFPATGTLKTIFIAEDTNKTYRWTGSAYVEISASQATAWGAITGTLSSQTDLQTALNAKVTGNTAITGATKTKVTYDSKGLVTAGADATTADIADSLNKRYVTDANLTVIGNTSGTNTGDQTLSGLGGVPTTRTITTTAPLTGGGDMSANRTFAITQATTTGDGYLSSTDWNTFNGKQPLLVSGTNIKTVNGTTILGSGDLTISTGITIGTTAITSGTVGRVLFEGTGNVVSESANITWNNTTNRFQIIGDSVINTLYIGLGGGQGATNTAVGVTALNANTTGVSNTAFGFETLLLNSTGSGNCAFGRKALRSTTGASNIAIGNSAMENNTSGSVNIAFGEGGGNVNTTGSSNIFIGNWSTGVVNNVSNRTWIGNTATTSTYLAGNILINTTTDAGYKLDVNGTARVSGILTAGSTINQGFTSSTTNVLLSTHTTSSTTNTGIYAPGGNAFGVVVNGTRKAYVSSSWQMNGGIIVQADGVNGNIDNSAMLQADSTTKGFLPPRMTTTQKNAIASPATGLMVYDTTLNVITYYNGTTWI